MNEEVGYLIKMGILFVLPFLILFFFKNPVNRHFRRNKSNIRIIDLVVPYFVVGIHIFSLTYSEESWIPYFLLFIFFAGIVLLFFFVFKLRALQYIRFFRVWWRTVFLISLLFFVGAGAFFLITLI